MARLAMALARRGHETHILCGRERGPGPAGVEVHPLGRFWWTAAGAIRRRLRAIRPDVIHFHDLTLPGGPGLLKVESPAAIKLLSAQEVPPKVTLHALDALICPDESRRRGNGGDGAGVVTARIPHLPADADEWAEADHLCRYLALVDGCRRARRIRFDRQRPLAGPKSRGRGRRESLAVGMLSLG